MSTSSEEFSKFVNRLLYEHTSNINSPKSLKHRTSENINKLTNFREGVNDKNEKHGIITTAKNNSSKHPKTSFPHKKILYQYNSIHRFLHQSINNSKQQSNAEDQMK